MSKFSRVSVCLLALVFLCTGSQVWGQASASTTSIYGQVTDQQAAAVVGAKVTIKNAAIALVRTTETDAVGRYQFLALPPGKYELRVEMTGFRTAVREKIELLVNTTSKMNIQLEVGAVTETVVVAEAAAALNTTNASMGNVMDSSQVSQLPLEGRNVTALLSLQTGATFLPTGDMRSGSISGSRSDQSNFTLDGVDINDAQGQTEPSARAGGYYAGIRVSQETLQEFRVSTSNYDATQGRSSAGQVSLITKSGSNDIHGSAFYYNRNTKFSSNEYFNKLAQASGGRPNKPPRLDKNLFGGSASAPIIKDRLFIFGSFEANRQQSETVVTRSVPSASFRDGVLIYRCTNNGINAPCPAAATTVAGLTGTHQVPAGFFGISPAQFTAVDPLGIGPNLAATTYFGGFPLPNNPGRDGQTVGGLTFGNIMGFTFTAPTERIQYSYDTKIDFNVDKTGNHRLFWRGTLQDDFIAGSPQFPGAVPNTVTLINPKLSVVGYNAVFSPRLVNTFRWGYLFFKAENAGLQNSNVSTFRFLSTVDGITSSNTRYFGTHNLVDDISYTRGSHNFQFGANVRFSRLPRSSNATSFHSAITNGSWLTGVGATFRPGRTTCNTVAAGGSRCPIVPAVASTSNAVWADSSIVLWGILSQGNGRYNYGKDGSIQPNGDPVRRKYGSNEYEMYFQDVWRLKSNVTVTLGVRWGIYSPPWEVDGNQVAPNPSFGQFFELRRQGMLAGVPNNLGPRISFDLAGPANGREGFYQWDYNNFSPRLALAYTPNFSSGPLGWLTGNGKMVIRLGYGIVNDRIGQALATSFDSGGSFGMSTDLLSPFGGLSERTAPRWTAINTVPGPPLIAPAPPGGFPSTPPLGFFAITNSIDNTNKTPYAHMMNVSIGREMPGKFNLEVAYVGRRGRSLLTKRDLAMPLNLVDPASGMDYFTAASQLAALAEVGDPTGFSGGTPTANVAPIPFWENIYPGMAGNPICNIDGLGAAATATQAVYDLYLCVAPDYTTALQFLDQGASPTDPVGLCTYYGSCSRFGPYTFFHDQYASLAGQSTIGRSEYHSMQVTVRKRMSHGLQFDLNYTLSKSLDMTSDIEAGSNFGGFFAGGYSEFVVNSWNPRQNYSYSTFDIRQQINMNWIYELPFGRNRWIGKNASGVVNQIIGNWNVTGLWRMTSGIPFSVINCRSCWPTNWNLQGNGSLFGNAFPQQRTTRGLIPSGGVSYPSPFTAISGPVTTLSSPTNPVSFFRRSRPGEVGFRNVMRGDGYFSIDFGVTKQWFITEKYRLQFRWETFNLTNTVRFDTGSLSVTPDLAASFGRYNSSLSTCDGAAGRCMQFALRFEF